MAKARKTEKPDGAPAAATKKKAEKKTEKKAPQAAAPLIDTALAAEAAARMVAARAAGTVPAPAAEAQGESSLFKQLKENLAHPHASSVDSFLNNTTNPSSRPSNVPFGSGGKQVGHNQTFGADVSRRNLPRRTGG